MRDGEKGPVRFPRGNPSLGQATARWASPTAADGNSRTADPATSREGSTSLTGQAAMWATPTAAMWRSEDGDGMRAPKHSPPLSRQVLRPAMPGAQSSPSDPTSSRRLNPLFVEWLMGWPIGWTACEPLGTEWCRWLLLSRSWLLRLGRT